MNENYGYDPFGKSRFSYNPYAYDNQNEGLSFSRNELQQILIAMGALTIAFSFALTPGSSFQNLGAVLNNIPLAFLAILTGFFFHELAHKYMGQKYGYWSEFRMYTQGLFLALFFGIFLGFIFALPGAVQIFGNPRRDEMGKIAMAGPFTNIILSGLFITLFITTTGIIAYVAFFIGSINAFLAFFNLLPFGMFDGKKVFNWRKEIWAILITISILLLLVLIV